MAHRFREIVSQYVSKTDEFMKDYEAMKEDGSADLGGLCLELERQVVVANIFAEKSCENTEVVFGSVVFSHEVIGPEKG